MVVLPFIVLLWMDIKLLLDKGADIEAKDNAGRTALNVADQDVAGLLLVRICHKKIKKTIERCSKF